MESSWLTSKLYFIWNCLLLRNAIYRRNTWDFSRAPLCLYWLCQPYLWADSNLYECRVRPPTINGCWWPCVWIDGYAKRGFRRRAIHIRWRTDWVQRCELWVYTRRSGVKSFEFHGRTRADGGLCRSYRFRKIFYYELALSILWPNEWSDLDWWQKHAWL